MLYNWSYSRKSKLPNTVMHRSPILNLTHIILTVYDIGLQKKNSVALVR
jgi:hypothetical protein